MTKTITVVLLCGMPFAAYAGSVSMWRPPVFASRDAAVIFTDIAHPKFLKIGSMGGYAPREDGVQGESESYDPNKKE